MPNKSISEQREENFRIEFAEQMKDLRERMKISEKTFNYIIKIICELPEETSVRLDNTDLWCILEETSWNYAMQRKNKKIEQKPARIIVRDSFLKFFQKEFENPFSVPSARNR